MISAGELVLSRLGRGLEREFSLFEGAHIERLNLELLRCGDNFDGGGVAGDVVDGLTVVLDLERDLPTRRNSGSGRERREEEVVHHEVDGGGGTS